MDRPVDETVFDRMVATRRDLHRYPELAWQEKRTSERIQSHLDHIGIPYRVVVNTGIIADLPAQLDAAPRVALRADLDALPIHEETGLPFASVTEGVMHACGHDGHISMVLGAAELLAGEPRLPAPVRLIFQPAEEQGAGSEAMIAAGALDDVAMIFGAHLDRHFPTGKLVVTDGVVNASTDRFSVKIIGRGGHAGSPHETVDAVVVGSLMVMAIQTIVSREIDPTYPSVVSVGRFSAGSAPNAIAAHAELEGTIRTQEPTMRVRLRDSIRRIAESTAKLHGAELELSLTEGLPVLENTPEMAEVAREAARKVVGPASVWKLRHANMGGEDFSRYLERVPGCYIRVGAQVPGREGFPAHSSQFDFDEEALAFGAAWFREVALVAGRRLLARERSEAPPQPVGKA